MNSEIEEGGRRWNEVVPGLPTSLTVEEGALVIRDIHPETLRGYLVSGAIEGRKIGTGSRAPWRLNKLALVRTLQLQTDEALLRDNEWHRTVASYPELLDTDQAAFVVRLTPATVRRLAGSGQIPSRQIIQRGTFTYPRDGLLSMIGVLGEFQPAA